MNKVISLKSPVHFSLIVCSAPLFTPTRLSHHPNVFSLEFLIRSTTNKKSVHPFNFQHLPTSILALAYPHLATSRKVSHLRIDQQRPNTIILQQRVVVVNARNSYSSSSSSTIPRKSNKRFSSRDPILGQITRDEKVATSRITYIIIRNTVCLVSMHVNISLKLDEIKVYR